MDQNTDRQEMVLSELEINKVFNEKSNMSSENRGENTN